MLGKAGGTGTAAIISAAENSASITPSLARESVPVTRSSPPVGVGEEGEEEEEEEDDVDEEEVEEGNDEDEDGDEEEDEEEGVEEENFLTLPIAPTGGGTLQLQATKPPPTLEDDKEPPLAFLLPPLVTLATDCSSP